MESSALSTFFLSVGSLALVLIVIFLGVILFYTVSILKVIHEIVVLTKTKAEGVSLRVTDLKKYVGGTTALRLLMFFFRKIKGKR